MKKAYLVFYLVDVYYLFFLLVSQKLLHKKIVIPVNLSGYSVLILNLSLLLRVMQQKEQRFLIFNTTITVTIFLIEIH